MRSNRMPYTTTGEVTLKLPTSLTVKFTDEKGDSHKKVFACSDTFSYNVGDSVTVVKQFGTWDLAGSYDPNPGFRRAFWNKG